MGSPCDLTDIQEFPMAPTHFWRTHVVYHFRKLPNAGTEFESCCLFGAKFLAGHSCRAHLRREMLGETFGYLSGRMLEHPLQCEQPRPIDSPFV